MTPREALAFLYQLKKTDPKYHKFLTEGLGFEIKDETGRKNLAFAKRLGKTNFIQQKLADSVSVSGWAKVPDYFDPLLSDEDLEFKNNKKRAAWGEADTNKPTPKITSEPVKVDTGDPDLVSDLGRNPSAKVPEQRGVYGPLVAKPVNTTPIGADPNAASKDAAARGLLTPADPSISNVDEARSSGLLEQGRSLRDVEGDVNLDKSKTTNMSYEEAKDHFKNRESKGTLFYTPKDWEAYAVMKEGGDGGA